MPPVRMMKVIPAASTMLIEASAGDIQQIAFREKVGGDKAENGDDQDEDRQNADGLHQVAHQHFFSPKRISRPARRSLSVCS